MSVFLRNGTLITPDKATLPVHHIEFSYGFGVYENTRVQQRVPFFPIEHAERLLESARIVGITHPFTTDELLEWMNEIVERETADAYNIKTLLIGGATPAEAQLFMFSLNPYFPKPKDYRDGVPVITVVSERFLPNAKSLNMLESYLAFRKAKAANAYDALFVDREGNAIEGTRTNLFGLKNKTIYGPPGERILDGVTRRHVLDIARQNGFDYTERLFRISELLKMDAAFLTGTGADIMPIASIDQKRFSPPVPPALAELMRAFNAFLDEYRARHTQP